MLIFGLFKQAIELEQALADLEEIQALREHILVVFLDQNDQKDKQQPSVPHIFEVGIAVATGTAVIGASLGFVLTLGPILLGLISALLGFILGTIAYTIFKKAKKQTIINQNRHEAIIVIECHEALTPKITSTLRQYNVISIGISRKSKQDQGDGSSGFQ